MSLKVNVALAAVLLNVVSGSLASTYTAEQHRAGVGITISPSSRITACRIVQPSDDSDGDALLCPLLIDRARGYYSNKKPLDIETALSWNKGTSPRTSDNQIEDAGLVIYGGPESRWLRIEDYPDELLHGAAGTVAVRFHVAPSGRIDECNVEDKSGHPALDDWTCRILKQRRVLGRHVDARGRPTGYVSRSVFYWKPDSINVCDPGEACGPK